MTYRMRHFACLKIFFVCCVSAVLSAACALPPLQETVFTSPSEKEIRKKWDTVKLPSAKIWVDYLPETDARGEVDFVKGTVLFETVIPVQTENIAEAGEK